MRYFNGLFLCFLVGSILPACQAAPAPVDPVRFTPIALSSTPSATRTTLPSTHTASPTLTPISSFTPTETPIPTSPTPTASPTALYRATPVFDEKGVLLRFTTEQDWVILTIDDGLSHSAALEMLDALKAANVRATFFLAGKCARDNLGPDVMQRLANEGHEIAYHSMEHPALEIQQGWTITDWEADYAEWQAAVLGTLGEELYARSVLPFARAPYGLFDKAFLRLCVKYKLLPVGWSCDPLCVDGTLPMPAGRILIYHVRGDQVESLKQLLTLGRTVLPLGEIDLPAP